MSELNHEQSSSTLQEKQFLDGTLRINYAETLAAGPPFVFLHGLARNWQDFLPLIPGLSDRHHIYALDLRGHGKSHRVAGGYTTAGYTSDIVNFLERTVGRPAVLFGHSLGGMIAMRIASQHPALVRALILGDTMLARETFSSSMYFSFFQTLHSLLLARVSVGDLARRLALAKIRVPGLDHPIAIGDLPGYNHASLLKWASCLNQVDPGALAMALDGSAYADYDADTWMRRIFCPTFLLQANPELGALMSESDVTGAMKILKRPTLKQFPLLGHALHQQGPASILQAVTSYLDSF